MKKIILSSIFLLNAFIGKAQSHAVFFVGIDYAQIRVLNKYNYHSLVIHEEGYSNESFVYGINGEKYISNKFSVALQFSYTKKEFDAQDNSFIPIKGLRFKSYKSGISFKWYPRFNWYIATGINLNYIPDVYVFQEPHIERSEFYFEGKKEYSSLVSTGYRYKNILIEICYNKGLSFNKSGDDSKVDLKPLNSIGILLGYQLQLSKKKRRK